MTKLLSLFSRAAHPNIDALSAEASEPPMAPSAIASHLSSCEDCARRVAGLRAVRVALQSLASEEAPRSFRLRQADIEAAAPGRAASPGAAALRLMPAMSALAVVLFAALVGADVLSNRGGGSSNLRAATKQDSVSRPAQASAQAPTLAPPSSLSNLPSPSGTGPGDRSSDQNAGAAAPAAKSTLEYAASQTIEANASGVTDNAPMVTPEAGTFSAPLSSDTEATQSARAPGPAAPAGELGSGTPAGSTDNDSGRTALHIAEAVVAALAIATGAIAVLRRTRSRGV